MPPVAATPAGTRIRQKKHKGIKADDITAFFQQLSTLLTAGTPLMRSLQVSGQQSESERFIVILRQLAADVASGSSLNDSMLKHPKLFENQWIEMIKAGERSGRLAETMEELTLYIKTRRAIRGKVVPTFAEFLTDFGSGLPPITKAVIAASDFVKTHIPHLIGGPIVLVAL